MSLSSPSPPVVATAAATATATATASAARLPVARAVAQQAEEETEDGPTTKRPKTRFHEMVRRRSDGRGSRGRDGVEARTAWRLAMNVGDKVENEKDTTNSNSHKRKRTPVVSGIHIVRRMLSIVWQVVSMASTLLPEESAKAFEAVQTMLEELPSKHGGVDVFQHYTAGEVISSISALSRLQRAADYAQDLKQNGRAGLVPVLSSHNLQRSNSGQETPPPHAAIEESLLEHLAHYAIFANAIYGWALSGKIHMSNLDALVKRTGIDKRDVVLAEWQSRTHRPAHYLVRDRKRGNLVLCIRGTLNAGDVLTDLCAVSEDFDIVQDSGTSSLLSLSSSTSTDGGPSMYEALWRQYFGGGNSSSTSSSNSDRSYTGRAHQGMIQSALNMAELTRGAIIAELATNPDFNLVIVGHSLGGGVAAVLGTMWRETFPGLSVYAYGCPCVGPLGAFPTTSTDIVSVVGEGDPFSVVSLGHVADLTTAVAKLCEDESLRRGIFQWTKTNPEKMDSAALDWCVMAMTTLRSHLKAEKCYPPGRILYLQNNGSVLREVPQESFGELKVHSRMLDVTRHVPGRYEQVLQNMYQARTQGGNHAKRSMMVKERSFSLRSWSFVKKDSK